MAKITVYLPDDLAARVKEYRGRLNISQIARAAIARAVAEQSAKEKTNMTVQATIDRLTAEKLENCREEWQIESKAIGRVWAMREASVEQLRRVPATNDPMFDGLIDDQLHDIWYSTVFGVDDSYEAREFWKEWLDELAHRGFPVEEVSVYDFTSGACDVHDELLEEKPELFL